jgi:hypothetical protein
MACNGHYQTMRIPHNITISHALILFINSSIPIYLITFYRRRFSPNMHSSSRQITITTTFNTLLQSLSICHNKINRNFKNKFRMHKLTIMENRISPKPNSSINFRIKFNLNNRTIIKHILHKELKKLFQYWNTFACYYPSTPTHSLLKDTPTKYAKQYPTPNYKTYT